MKDICISSARGCAALPPAEDKGDGLYPAGRADPQRAAFTIRVLTINGYTVRHAASAASALLVVRQECPTLILLNLELPDISGQSLALRIKRELKTNAPPIVALTEYDVVSSRSSLMPVPRGDLAQSARQAGCITILTEPLSMEELCETVSAQLLDRA